MVVLLQHSPQKGTEIRAAIGTAHDNARMRLASQAARLVVLDWMIAEERIHWDGASEILPFPLSGGHPQAFLDAVTRAGRDALAALLESKSAYSSPFELNLEMASALGAVGFTFAGTRVPDNDGRTERLVGILRENTEKQREMQRLTYLATRDELTGHLNRNALRTELQLAITRAKDECRHCAFLVASIDRLAMINDGYGFDAGEEVIVGVGERLAKSLRASDIIGRTAGNKFGVILKNCKESEISVVAGRLKRAVREHPIETPRRKSRRHHLCGRGLAAAGRRQQPGGDAARRAGAGTCPRQWPRRIRRLCGHAAARDGAPAPDGDCR